MGRKFRSTPSQVSLLSGLASIVVANPPLSYSTERKPAHTLQLDIRPDQLHVVSASLPDKIADADRQLLTGAHTAHHERERSQCVE